MSVPSLAVGGPLILMQAAIRLRLQQAFPAAQFGFDLLPAQVGPVEFKRLQRRLPSLALGWVGWTPDGRIGREFRGRTVWVVALLTRRSGTVAGRVVGDATGLGQLGMAQVAIAMLHGWTVSQEDLVAAAATLPAIASLLPSAGVAPGGAAQAAWLDGAMCTVDVTEAENVYSEAWGEEDCAVTTIKLSAHLSLDDPDAFAGLEDFLRMGVTWDFEPGGDAVADPPFDVRGPQ